MRRAVMFFAGFSVMLVAGMATAHPKPPDVLAVIAMLIMHPDVFWPAGCRNFPHCL